MRSFLSLSILLIAVPALGDELIEEGCVECHGVSDLTTRDPISGREYQLGIDLKGYGVGVHGKLLCKACHERGYDRIPHANPRRRDSFQCLHCHRNDGVIDVPSVRRAAIERSVHWEKVGAQHDCHACHDPHIFSPPPRKGRPRVEWANATCLRCHDEAGGRVPFDKARAAKGAHSFLPHESHHLRVTECASCHGDHGESGHSVMAVEDAVQDCRRCHAVNSDLLRPKVAPELFVDAYVIGATKSARLDSVSIWLLVAFAIAIVFHLAARVFLRDAPEQRVARNYSLWLRIWHSLHAATFLFLVVSGLAVHYTVWMPFAFAVRSHNIAGVALLVLWLWFLVANVTSKNARNYRIPRPFVGSVAQMARWYLVGMFRGRVRPFDQRRLNPLQGLSYLLVMYALTPGCALSGALLLFPGFAPDRVGEGGGLWPMALLHLATAWGLSLFLLMHVYMVTTGPYIRWMYGSRASSESLSKGNLS